MLRRLPLTRPRRPQAADSGWFGWREPRFLGLLPPVPSRPAMPGVRLEVAFEREAGKKLLAQKRTEGSASE